MHQDSYTKREKQRFHDYVASYESPEAATWRASLSPEQRQHAEKFGLLAPQPDKASSSIPLEEEVACISVHDSIAEPNPLFRFLDTTCKKPRHRRALDVFLGGGKHIGLRWAIIRYLSGEGTGELHAARFGLTKQAFDKHAELILKKFTGTIL